MMELEVLVIIATMGCAVACAQDSSDGDLARLLAANRTRQDAIAKIVASGNEKVPLLLSWTRNPPSAVDESELYIGLADAFGQLKTKEAIPFLIKNISLSRWVRVDIWLKTPEVIEEHLPAVGALIRIGPEASRALIRIPWEQMAAKDRLAAIFVVARIKDPEARGFLASALGQANQERYWAEEGLKLLDRTR